MRVKVICPILIYNGEIYHEGDYVEVENEVKRERMIQGHSVVDPPDFKTKPVKNVGTKYNKVKRGKKNGNRRHNRGI